MKEINNVTVSSATLSVSIKEFEEMERAGIQMDITNPIFKKALAWGLKEVVPKRNDSPITSEQHTWNACIDQIEDNITKKI